MARIIENMEGKRKLIKLSTQDIISIVQDYQRIVPRGASYELINSYLNDTVIYIPEDI